MNNLRAKRLFFLKKSIFGCVVSLGVLGGVSSADASEDTFPDHGHRHKRVCKAESRLQEDGCVPSSLLQTPPRISRSILQEYSPETKTSLWYQGVNPDVLHSSIEKMLESPLRKSSSMKVRDLKTRTKIISGSIIPSPSLRKAQEKGSGSRVVTRVSFPKTIQLGNRSPVPVVHLHPSVEIPEEPPEAYEERVARRRNQRALLIEARRQQVGEAGEDAWSHEQATLNLFVNYLNLRKQRDKGKIRRVEIEETLDEILTESGYQSFTYKNYVVWFHLKTMFLDLEDPQTGLTGLDLLKIGRPPVSFDGKPMHLHHATLYDGATHATTSYLLLLSNRAHSEEFADALHFSTDFYWMPKKPVDRLLFDPTRPKILINLERFLAVLDSPEESVEEMTIFELRDDSLIDGNWEKSLQPLL